MNDANEITIYEKNEKTYCEDCKPKGGKRGTLVLSLPDRVFCDGCGEDFLDIVTGQAHEPQVGDKVHVHGLGFGSGQVGEVVSQVFQGNGEQGTIDTTCYCLVDLPKYGSIAFVVSDLQIIPLVQCPRCQCLVHEDELRIGCPVCSYPKPPTHPDTCDCNPCRAERGKQAHEAELARVARVVAAQKPNEEEQALLDAAYARAVALGRPFEKQEIFQPIWDKGLELNPQMDSRFILVQEATGKTSRLWGVTPPQHSVNDAVKPRTWSSHQQVRAAYEESLAMWDEVLPASPDQMDKYDSSVIARVVVTYA